MTAVLMPVVILASGTIAGPGEGEHGRGRPGAAAPWPAAAQRETYFALLLVLETMICGVFAATDVFPFSNVFFEAS